MRILFFVSLAAFTFASASFLACSSSDSSTGGSSGKGGSGTGGSGTGGSGTGGSATGGATGACTNSADQAIINDTSTDAGVDSIVTQCGQTNLGAEPATKNCILQQTGLSDPCASCYDATVTCAAQHCIQFCLTAPNGTECTDCLAQNCDPAFATCSGISN